MINVTELQMSVEGRLLYSDINFQVDPHQTIGILGCNGSGKTTLLHLMAGLKPIRKGNVYYNHKSIADYSGKARAQLVGILFQENNDNFPQTVYEVCSQGRYPYLKSYHSFSTLDETIINTALLDMELSDFFNKKIQTLSGGEKRRLNIARLLTQTPRVYLLDEPTNHLDIYYQQKVFEHFTLLKNTHPVSIVCVTHDLHYAEKYCDKILLLFKNGEYIFGPAKEVLTTHQIARLFAR